jgi:hypothetical protein
MARKQESREFKVSPKGEGTEAETVTILVTALDGNSGGELGIRLLQMLGPSIIGVIAAMELNDMTALTTQAASFFSKIGPTEFKVIRQQLLKGAQVQELGEFADLNDAWIGDRFAGHAGSLMALMAFALKVNYANFFDDLGVSKETIAKLTARAAKAKKAATG